MIETNKQFEDRLGIDYNSKGCNDKWQECHDKIIRDFKEYCPEMWDYQGGNFRSQKPNSYWKEYHGKEE